MRVPTALWTWKRLVRAAALFTLCAGLSSLLAGAMIQPISVRAQGEAGKGFPTLTTAHAVHSLTGAEAVRGYPVVLRAVVTYFDSNTDPKQTAVFVHDASGGVYIALPPGWSTPFDPGAVIEVRGVSGLGNYAPIVDHARVTVLGRSALPPPGPQASLTRLRTGAEDGQWVQVEGVVRSVVEKGKSTLIRLAMPDGVISVLTASDPRARFDELIDARVQIDGDASPLFNGNGQLTGSRLVTPGLVSMRVVDAAPPHPFSLPPVPIDSLWRFNPKTTSPHRVHIRGTVTLLWPGSLLCVRDATHGLCAQTSQATPVGPGAIVDIAGFPGSGEDAPVLTDAVYQDTGVASSITAASISAEQSDLVKHDAELVALEGQLIGRDLAALNPTLMLSAGNYILRVVLPRDLSPSVVDQWKFGSRLRVTGICMVTVDAEGSAIQGGYLVPRSFRLMLRSADDIEVIKRASWWTPGHGLLLASLALTITLGVVLWGVVQRRRVKQSEEQFRHLAQHDALTGLPTRLLLHDRLEQALVRSARHGTRLAVLMLDLDKFKQINDTYGHPGGDRTLEVTAERLRSIVRQSDTVARMGGDEFVVLLDDIGYAREAEVIAAKVVEALCHPVKLGDREIPVSSSVGLCTAAGAGLNAELLLKKADVALYHAKAEGRNCYKVYSEDMARATGQQLSLQHGLSRALGLDEFELHYQPMVDFQTGQLTGFEALLRWRSKVMGLIMPTDFIALAEQSGLIVPIGEWVLREACREIGWLERGFNRTFRLAVNLSPRQFQEPGLSEMIQRVLVESGRAPETIEFEITERMLMTDTPQTQSALEELRDLGVRVAIDDFGTGFSNLSYITRFSIDSLKIDRSFAQACVTDRNSLAVVRAIVAMAFGLDIHVIAEGVETVEQFEFLRAEGCGTAQGYYLGRPMPADELVELLQNTKTLGVVDGRTVAAALQRTAALST